VRRNQTAGKRGLVDFLDKKMLPKSVELERELLLALLVAGDVNNLDGLHLKDFTDELHCDVYKAMRRVQSGGAKELEVAVVLADVGEGARRDMIVEWLSRWRDSHGVPGNVPYYKRQLRDLRVRRARILVGLELAKRSYDMETRTCDTGAWLATQIDLIGHL